MRARWLAVVLVIAIIPVGAQAGERVLFDPASMLGTAERMDFVGRNIFAAEPSEKGIVLRSTPHRSASGLYEGVDLPAQSLTNISWGWRVDQLQAHADIRELATEDFGAAVFFIFGEPTLFNRDVPTIAYVWSATPVANATVLRSKRFASLRFVQLRGRGDVGGWHIEGRNVAADFRAIFGKEPPMLRKIAVFNDNDQTGEPTSALFGSVVCETPC